MVVSRRGQSATLSSGQGPQGLKGLGTHDGVGVGLASSAGDVDDAGSDEADGSTDEENETTTEEVEEASADELLGSTTEVLDMMLEEEGAIEELESIADEDDGCGDGTTALQIPYSGEHEVGSQ